MKEIKEILNKNVTYWGLMKLIIFYIIIDSICRYLNYHF